MSCHWTTPQRTPSQGDADYSNGSPAVKRSGDGGPRVP